MTVAADWRAIRRELPDDAAVTMDEPSGRLHDACTARLGNREDGPDHAYH
jgi:hypothetical protein